MIAALTGVKWYILKLYDIQFWKWVWHGLALNGNLKSHLLVRSIFIKLPLSGIAGWPGPHSLSPESFSLIRDTALSDQHYSMEQSICCAEMRGSRAVESSSWGIRESFTRGMCLQPDLKVVGNGKMKGREGRGLPPGVQSITQGSEAVP